MFATLVYVFFIVASTAVSTTFKETPDSCSLTEFSCGDGGCVSSDLICDGTRDCADGSDEKCGIGSSQLSLFNPVLHRSRRQARRCSKVQWQCRDGSCISFDGKCDGVVDCADGSDETHALCRNSQCQYNWFRCTYGACVDGTAPCNGKQECADNSDELLPKCRNETDEVRGQFKCRDGSFIPAANHCDGVRDCPDGSDETVRACAAKTCPSYLFQCAYGACVDSGADCNKITECADGSDEAVELCGSQGGVIPPPTTGSTSRPPSSSGDCVLPPYPDHGTYTTDVGGKPGQAYDFVSLTVTCRRGYGVRDKNSSICYTGIWHNPIPECLPMCELKKNPSIEYRCLVPNIQGSRICNGFEHNGTIVIPECVAPNYYSPTTLTYMTCIDGSWDHQATCIPGLTKNGTNITILIKETVQIHVSDFQYTVPIIAKPVVPITDNSDKYSVYDDSKYSNSKPDRYNSGNNFINNNNNNEAVSKVDDSDYDIDDLDWRMGPTTTASGNSQNNNDRNHNNNRNSNRNRNNDPQKDKVNPVNKDNSDAPNNSYRLKNNKATIHFNITNSSVYINADDRLIFSN